MDGFVPLIAGEKIPGQFSVLHHFCLRVLVGEAEVTALGAEHVGVPGGAVDQDPSTGEPGLTGDLDPLLAP